jgi:hypothetical protein
MLVVVDGQRFGRGIVVERFLYDRGKRCAALVCECGTRYVARISDLLRGHVRSCGCIRGKPPHVVPGSVLGDSLVMFEVAVGNSRGMLLRCGLCGEEYRRSHSRIARGRHQHGCQRRAHVIRPSQQYGRATVIRLLPEQMVYLRCSCGQFFTARTDHVADGSTRSCGCLRREVSRRRRNVIHGYSDHPLYHSWLWNRRRYGTALWRDPALFVADVTNTVGARPAGAILTRKDAAQPWDPANLRWRPLSRR